MKDYLYFNEMIVPKLIPYVFWVMLALVVLKGLGVMFSGGFSGFLAGIVTIAAGAIFARVACEVLVVVFKINESLHAIREKP